MSLLGRQGSWKVHGGICSQAPKKALVSEVLLSGVVAESLFGAHRDGSLLPWWQCRPVLSASALCLSEADLFPTLVQLHLKEGMPSQKHPDMLPGAHNSSEHVQEQVTGPGLCSTSESFKGGTMGAFIL